MRIHHWGPARDADEDAEEKPQDDDGMARRRVAAHEVAEAQEALEHQEREIAPDDVEIEH